MTALNADGRSPEPLHAYIAELKRLGKDAFREAYGDAFLMFDSGSVRGRGAMAATTLEPRPDDAGDEATAPTSFEVMPVRSRTGGSTVRVGRIDDCDLIISDQSVSSVHAIFERGDTGGLTLRDNGSKNGTFVDERLVAAPGRGEPHPLRARHSLRFGSLSAVFLDLDGFHEMARMFDHEIR